MMQITNSLILLAHGSVGATTADPNEGATSDAAFHDEMLTDPDLADHPQDPMAEQWPPMPPALADLRLVMADSVKGGGGDSPPGVQVTIARPRLETVSDATGRGRPADQDLPVLPALSGLAGVRGADQGQIAMPAKVVDDRAGPETLPQVSPQPQQLPAQDQVAAVPAARPQTAAAAAPLVPEAALKELTGGGAGRMAAEMRPVTQLPPATNAQQPLFPVIRPASDAVPAGRQPEDKVADLGRAVPSTPMASPGFPPAQMAPDRVTVPDPAVTSRPGRDAARQIARPEGPITLRENPPPATDQPLAKVTVARPDGPAVAPLPKAMVPQSGARFLVQPAMEPQGSGPVAAHLAARAQPSTFSGPAKEGAPVSAEPGPWRSFFAAAPETLTAPPKVQPQSLPSAPTEQPGPPVGQAINATASGHAPAFTAGHPAAQSPSSPVAQRRAAEGGLSQAGPDRSAADHPTGRAAQILHQIEGPAPQKLGALPRGVTARTSDEPMAKRVAGAENTAAFRPDKAAQVDGNLATGPMVRPLETTPWPNTQAVAQTESAPKASAEVADMTARQPDPGIPPEPDAERFRGLTGMVEVQRVVLLPDAPGLPPPEIAVANPASTALRAEAGVAAQPATPPPAAVAQTLHALQAHVSKAEEGRVEVLLAPADLGRLWFDIRFQGDEMRIHVTAERPETLETLRRHADQLLADLRQGGFGAASGGPGGFGQGTLSFGSRSGREPPAPPDKEDGARSLAGPESPPLARTVARPDAGLNLRL